MSQESPTATIDNKGNPVDEEDWLIPVREVFRLKRKIERGRARGDPPDDAVLEPSDEAFAPGDLRTEMHALRTELEISTEAILMLEESIDALAASIAR